MIAWIMRASINLKKDLEKMRISNNLSTNSLKIA
jgi:hypothetical protein